MTKNKKRNAFFYFMLEWKNRRERQGQHFPNGLRDVQASAECNKEWQDLPAERKNEYKLKAKQSCQTVVKKNAIGVPILEVAKAEAERVDFYESMKKYLDLKINKAKELHCVQKLKFYVVHTNYYYKKIVDAGDDRYIPAEIGIAEFSLENGVTKVYHSVITPHIEIGYAAEAKEYSSTSHQLPTTDGEIGEKKYDSIYEQICSFLESGREDKKLPPLFTPFGDEEILNPVISILDILSESGSEKFVVYSLEQLYIRLHNIYDKVGYRKLDDVEALAYLRMDPHDYEISTGCEYHKSVIRVAKFCSRSYVQRWIYSVCSNCCPFLNIELQPGAHFPASENGDTKLTDPLSAKFQYMKINSSSSPEETTQWKTTGAIKKYVKNKSERSHGEEESRRFDAPPLHITDHSIKRATPENKAYVHERPLRRPLSQSKTLSMTLNTDDNSSTTSSYDNNFPSLSVGRGRRIRNDTTSPKTNWASKFK